VKVAPRSVAATAVLLLLPGCRGPEVTLIPEGNLPEDIYASPNPAPSPTNGDEPVRRGTVYMVKKGRLFGVTTELPSAPSRPEALLAAVLRGPPDPARAASVIPPGTRALDVGVVSGVATVNLSQEFTSGAARETLALRVAQIVYTLTEDPNVVSVVFAFEGTPAPVITGDARVPDRPLPVGRKDYARFAPAEDEG
jgi:hypothetical protein